MPEEATDASPAGRGQLRLLVAASVVHAGAILVLPPALGRAVDSVLGGAPQGGGPFRGARNPFGDFVEPLDLLNRARDAAGGALGSLTWVQATVALIVLVVVSESLVAYAGDAATARVSAGIRTRLVRHATAAGPGLGRAFPPGDLVTRGTGNAGAAGAARTSAVTIWAAALPALGALVLLFRIDPRCGAAFLVGLALLSAVLAVLLRRATDVTGQYQATQGEIAAGLTEALGGARTIAAAGSVGAETRRILAPLPGLRRHGYGIWRAQAAGMGQATALVPMLEVAVLSVAGWQLTRGHLSVGGLLAAAGYVVLAAELVSALGAAVALAQARSAAARCAAVLEVPASPYGTARLPAGPGTVEFAGVWVGEGPRAALRGVTVSVPGGTTVAVVGASGSGKSTLAALLGRLTDPDRGMVRLDGVPLAELAPDVLHRAVTYAFARPALLGRTVADTIALGPDLPDRLAVVAAARDACAAAFIERLPLGYDTPLELAPLSGGEAQRLGLARAFAHPGRVLVLDDATSSLDTVTELQVTEAIAARHGSATRLIVAHRASTAARADRVLWLESGGVRGYAPHRELWANPRYRAVFGSDGSAEADAPLATVTALPGPVTLTTAP